MNEFKCLSPNDLAALATSIAIILTQNLDEETQEVVSNFLQAVGQTMCLISAQVENCKEEEDEDNDEKIKDLQKQIDELKRCIKNL